MITPRCSRGTRECMRKYLQSPQNFPVDRGENSPPWEYGIRLTGLTCPVTLREKTYGYQNFGRNGIIATMSEIFSAVIVYFIRIFFLTYKRQNLCEDFMIVLMKKPVDLLSGNGFW